ncbi:polysaccharide biosynthesis/export family protein [Mucilaginibacter sp.]|uniref:polysaccharide biosynthesis/export family protein n=1 Tax=Mucilaginibacter sp. TaxID=1882438 RepID=UPI0026293FB4|nr:polysaccharide biosynthesis/export family protein [Mucilaginibacter sp.]MDB4919047.1 Polysaccharide export outer membrane protein [Mucilaginibacter sp.]
MKKNLSLNIFLFLACIVTLTSCIDQKKYIYFQKNLNQSDTINVAKAYIPKIQPGDILFIPISSLNPAASSFFNPFSSGGGGSDNSAAAITGALPGGGASAASSSSAYLVDSAGMIEFPIIGGVKVGGLNTSDARDTIKKRLKFYLKEPTVNIRFLNYKISVMGEVARPSVYVIPNERVSLPEAISMAGDLTPFAKHENLLVIRDNNGTKEFGRVNLNSRDIFTSPYYYLHSGDIVYIEQTKTKAAQNDPTIRLLPVMLSALAALLLIVYRIK